jgi:hypothetical protein
MVVEGACLPRSRLAELMISLSLYLYLTESTTRSRELQDRVAKAAPASTTSRNKKGKQAVKGTKPPVSSSRQASAGRTGLIELRLEAIMSLKKGSNAKARTPYPYDVLSWCTHRPSKPWLTCPEGPVSYMIRAALF